MTPGTPETAVIDEMETPVEISQDEMEDARYSYDLPQNDIGQSEMKTADDVTTPASPASEAPEQDSQSEIPGDPRDPHQTQPPTSEQY
ncbi:MAG: hypothetical protein H7145_09500 [Akkermansiaceae bacterium]|nr:hypothetical protein [Armatimonadota bacterium]